MVLLHRLLYQMAAIFVIIVVWNIAWISLG